MRLTWMSKSAAGSTTMPVRSRMRRASASLFARLTARHRSWKAASSASGSSARSRDRSVTQPSPTRLVQELRQRRVAEHEEAARRDAVGHVVEALGPELREVPEHGLPQQLGMQRGNAVDRVAADGREVGHAHALLARLVDQRQARDARVVAGVRAPDLVEEAAVDLVDDLERPRQQAAEERQPPGLERLGQAACGWCRRACGG